MNRLSIERRAQILGMLCEGNSLRSTSRMADVSINTVTKLLVDVGAACGGISGPDASESQVPTHPVR